MRATAVDLKEFYDTVQGRMVRRILRQRLRAMWPDTKGLRVLGLGYAVPFLKVLATDAERAAAFMPAQQGAVFWPRGDKGLVCICREDALPVESNSVDRILVIHGMQDFESMNAGLRECWRVLSGQGRLVLVVPNRAGVWARFDATPFGVGTPWSSGQIRKVLKEHLFVPERVEPALFMPPTASRLLLATAPAWEGPGRRFFGAFGGVHIVEASKQIYAGIPAAPATAEAAALRRRRPLAKPAATRDSA